MDEHGGGGMPEEEQARRDLIARFAEFEHFFSGTARRGFDVTRHLAKEGEALWPVFIAIGAALAMQIALPNDLELPPPWLLPVIGIVLGIALLIGNLTTTRMHITHASSRLRVLALTLTGVIGLGNAYSAVRLVQRLLSAGESDAVHLLRVGGSIWLTNVIVFTLLYWQFDRGGPVARLQRLKPYPDFLFPQWGEPRLAPQGWEPQFVDYFYFSFTNATAFSPTDVMPLTRWAKLTMLSQSAVSLATVALVIARAVNILK